MLPIVEQFGHQGCTVGGGDLVRELENDFLLPGDYTVELEACHCWELQSVLEFENYHKAGQGNLLILAWQWIPVLHAQVAQGACTGVGLPRICPG